MGRSDLQSTFHDKVDVASKCVGLSVGGTYLIGFIAVTARLSIFGVSSFSVLQLQYLIAGVWVLGPPVALFSVPFFGGRFEERASPSEAKRQNWHRLVVASLMGAIPSSILTGMIVIIPGLLGDLTWRVAIKFFFFFLGIIFCGRVCWDSFHVDAEHETWLLNRRHAAPFYLTTLLLLILAYAVWFGVRVYPLIPFSLGGGRPRIVSFILREKDQPDGIARDGTSNRSVLYRLLVATDRSYVILSPKSEEKSIEFDRGAVAGMVVVKEP